MLAVVAVPEVKIINQAKALNIVYVKYYGTMMDLKWKDLVF